MELSQQRYVWAYTGIQYKQLQLHTDWSLLNNWDISDKYTITQRNKFNVPQEISKTLTPNDKYENFVDTIIEAAEECIPTKLRAKHSSMGDISC